MPAPAKMTSFRFTVASIISLGRLNGIFTLQISHCCSSAGEAWECASVFSKLNQAQSEDRTLLSIRMIYFRMIYSSCDFTIYRFYPCTGHAASRYTDTWPQELLHRHNRSAPENRAGGSWSVRIEIPRRVGFRREEHNRSLGSSSQDLSRCSGDLKSFVPENQGVQA